MQIEPLPQFLTNAHIIWYKHWSWGKDVQDILFFDVLETGLPWKRYIMAINDIKVFRIKLHLQVLTNAHNTRYTHWSWGKDVQDTFFTYAEKMRCHGNGKLWQ